MIKTLTSSIEIAGSPTQVWAVLSALEDYPSWNPFIVSAQGTLVPGGRLQLRMQPAGGAETTVRPSVLEAEPGRRLRWLGRLGLPGLFDAKHEFLLTAKDGGTVLIQRENFRGLLVRPFARMLDRSTLPAFVAMNVALKERVEAQKAVAQDTFAQNTGATDPALP